MKDKDRLIKKGEESNLRIYPTPSIIIGNENKGLTGSVSFVLDKGKNYVSKYKRESKGPKIEYKEITGDSTTQEGIEQITKQLTGVYENFKEIEGYEKEANLKVEEVKGMIKGTSSVRVYDDCES